MNTKKIGDLYEEKTVSILKSKGLTILETNYRCKLGEIDIIAKDKNVLCFIEVKYRKKRGAGFGEEAVNIKKQRKILLSAKVYISEHALNMDMPYRFDVFAINDNRCRYIKNAFMADF